MTPECRTRGADADRVSDAGSDRRRAEPDRRRRFHGRTGTRAAKPQLDLLFSGSTPLSRHCSALGALDAAPRVGAQARRYLQLLAARGPEGLTDWEARILLGLERTTITARRWPLCHGDDPWVTSCASRPGPSGVRNAVWILTDTGRAGVAALQATEAR